MVKLTYSFITIKKIVKVAMNSMRLSIITSIAKPIVRHHYVTVMQRLLALSGVLALHRYRLSGVPSYLKLQFLIMANAEVRGSQGFH